MELPHLTLYLRRLAAPVPWRDGLGPVLRTPRVRWWLNLAGWLAAAGGYALARRSGWIGPLSDPYSSLVLVVFINLALYLPLAARSAGLAAEPAPDRRLRGASDPPLWYPAPLASRAAVTGTLLQGLVAIAPTAVGCMALLSVQQWLDQPAAYSLGAAPSVLAHSGEWGVFLWTNLGALLRLPQLALAAMALRLGLRRTPAAPFVPAALALASIMAAATGEGWGAGSWSVADAWGLPDLGARALPFVLAALGLWGTNGLLRRFSAADTARSGALAALGFTTLLPCLVGVASWNWPLGLAGAWAELGVTALHAYHASYLPDLWPLSLQSVLSLPRPSDLDSARYLYLFQLYGQDVGIRTAWLLAAAGYLASLAFWFATAVQCLDAARGRGPARYNRLPPR